MTIFVTKGPSTAPASGANDHFDTQVLDANHHASWDLRSNTNINTVISGTTVAGTDAVWEYDASIDAAKVTFASGGNLSLSSSAPDAQLWCQFAVLNPSTANIMSWQFEVRYGAEWADQSNHTTAGAFNNHKGFRMDYDDWEGLGGGPTENRRIEDLRRYTDTASAANGAVCIPEIRAYDMVVDETDWNSQLTPVQLRYIKGTATIDNNDQPGGTTAAWQQHRPIPLSYHLNPDPEADGRAGPFLCVSEKWARFTLTWDWTSGTGATKLIGTASDEDNDAVTYFDSVASGGSGMLIESNTFAETGGDKLNVEFNSSQGTPTADIDHRIWVRNLIVFKDKAIPHGGRPVA